MLKNQNWIKNGQQVDALIHHYVSDSLSGILPILTIQKWMSAKRHLLKSKKLCKISSQVFNCNNLIEPCSNHIRQAGNVILRTDS